MSLQTSSAKTRFLSALRRESVDRIPVGNVVSIATIELMQECDAWYPKAHTDAETMAALAAAGHEILGYDTVMPVFSVTQEAAALGCKVDWGDSRTAPTVRSRPFVNSEQMSIPDDWFSSPSIQVVLDAIRILRETLGDKAVIVGKAMGPWSLSYHMMGTEEFLLTTALDPEKARDSLSLLKQVTKKFANAQMQAGADIICMADHATGMMVSPLVYRDMLLPIHKEITSEIDGPVVLHCCGNTNDRLEYFAESGIVCYHFESQVDIKKAVEVAKGKIALMGNVNNPEILLSGDRDEVIQACHNAINAGVNILAPECAVPLTTPLSNLRALVEAVGGEKR